MRDTVDFLLRHWLHVDALSRRERFAEHTWETFAAVLDTCARIARDRFAPFNRRVDIEEPRIEPGPDGERVVLPAVTQAAWDAYAAGLGIRGTGRPSDPLLDVHRSAHPRDRER